MAEMNNTYIALAGACLFLVTLRAQTPATPQTGPPRRTRTSDLMQRPEVQRGQKLFVQSCSPCHGISAEGGAEGPSLVLSGVVRHDKSGDLIGEVIREGRPAKGMPSFQFNASQIADIVAFLHARVTISDVRSAGKNGSYSLKQLLTGNAAAGKQFFDGAGGCSGCHSPTGDLAGIANRYQPVELQALFLYPADTVHETAEVVLPSGQTYKGDLLHLDAFTVALKGAGGWYHSWPVRAVKVTIHDPLTAHRKLLYKYTNADMHNLFAYLETLK